MGTNARSYRHDPAGAEASPFMRVSQAHGHPEKIKIARAGPDPETGREVVLWPVRTLRLKAEPDKAVSVKLDLADFLEVSARFGICNVFPEFYRGRLYRAVIATGDKKHPRAILARLIMGNFRHGEPKNRIVSTINGDPLDLRRCNLATFPGGRGGVSNKAKKRADADAGAEEARL